MRTSLSRARCRGLALALALVAVAAATPQLTPTAHAADEAKGTRSYEVRIVNLNLGQPLAPPILIPHNARFALFQPGVSSATATSC